MNEARKKVPFDPVQRPAHYNRHPSGVEVADITDGLNFNVGNAFKYLGRGEHKGEGERDLGKALWYVKREIALREKDAVDAAEEQALAREKWLESEPDPELMQIYDLVLSASEDETDTEALAVAAAKLEERLAALKARA